MPGWSSLGCEHRPTQRERQRENGVFPLDHLQRGAEVVEERHEWILLQVSGVKSQALALRSWVSGVGCQFSGITARISIVGG